MIEKLTFHTVLFWLIGGASAKYQGKNLKIWGLLVGCLTFQQHASVCQGGICSDNFTCCHTEIEVADQTFYLTQSQYTDTRLSSPSADPITPGAWQGSYWSAKFWVTGMTRPRKIPAQAGFEPRIFHSWGGRLTTRPTRRYGYSEYWQKYVGVGRSVVFINDIIARLAASFSVFNTLSSRIFCLKIWACVALNSCFLNCGTAWRTNVECWREIMGNSGGDDSVFKGFTGENLFKVL